MREHLISRVKERKIDEFRRLIGHETHNKWLDNIISPLDPGLLLSKLSIEKAKIFDSKKCPIMLTWENGSILFKAEDDLRQDVLGIQMLKVIDSIWKESGLCESKYILDLNLTPYRTL